MKITMAGNEQNPVSIDNIPYEILYHIISLIPLKEAARTIILSSSWKHLWTQFQVSKNINFDQVTSQEPGQMMNQFISAFLNTYKTSYHILNFYFLEPKTPCEKTLFSKAVKGVDKELHISFHGEKPELSTLSIELPLCENEHFFSLKTLHLRSITRLAGSFLLELFTGCRNLETLSLEKCSGLQNVDLKAHDLLQKFVVLDCENMVSVTISSAPNLKCFIYRGILVKIQVKNVPKLCDVTLNFMDISLVLDHTNLVCEDVVPLLASLKDIEVLTLSGWFIEWLCTRGVMFDELEFKFDNLKKLSLTDCCMNPQTRDSLASFLSITPLLENLVIEIDERWYTISSPPLHHQSHLRVWTNSTTTIKSSSNDLQLNHLKLVKFFGFKIEEENLMLVALMDLFLKKSIAMKKMSVIDAENKLSWRVAKVPQSHLKKIASSSTRSCYSSKSPLLLSLNKKCYFQLTPDI